MVTREKQSASIRACRGSPAPYLLDKSAARSPISFTRQIWSRLGMFFYCPCLSGNTRNRPRVIEIYTCFSIAFPNQTKNSNLLISKTRAQRMRNLSTEHAVSMCAASIVNWSPCKIARLHVPFARAHMVLIFKVFRYLPMPYPRHAW